jgi:hypothetical protein
MGDVGVVRRNDLGAEVNRQHHDCAIDDVAGLRASEKATRRVRVRRAEVGDVAASQESAQLSLAI